MNRLLQGDVGSGKTVVAALAAAIVNQSGAQAAIMAPTSILAEQHFRSFSTICWQARIVRLLVGDTPESEKAEIREGLANGTIKVIVGTHALIEDPVTFQTCNWSSLTNSIASASNSAPPSATRAPLRTCW